MDHTERAETNASFSSALQGRGPHTDDAGRRVAGQEAHPGQDGHDTDDDDVGPSHVL